MKEITGPPPDELVEGMQLTYDKVGIGKIILQLDNGEEITLEGPFDCRILDPEEPE